MELEQSNEVFIEPSVFNEKINQMNGSIDLLLEEYKKICILSKMHPANQEYQQQYENMKSGLNHVQSTLLSISNEVQQNINKLNRELLLLDADIKKEKELNKELKKKIGFMENKTNAASEMIDDYNQIYDERYLRNWGLGLSTLLCIFTIGSIFKV